MSKLTLLMVAYLCIGAFLATGAWLQAGRYDRNHPTHPAITCAFLTLCWPFVLWFVWRQGRDR